MADKEENRRRRPAGPYTPAGGYGEPGPVDEAERGQIDDEDPSPDDPDSRSGVTAGLSRTPGGPGVLSESAESAGPGEPREPGAEGGHVTAGLDWTNTDEDDPDVGSGRT